MRGKGLTLDHKTVTSLKLESRVLICSPTYECILLVVSLFQITRLKNKFAFFPRLFQLSAGLKGRFSL